MRSVWWQYLLQQSSFTILLVSSGSSHTRQINQPYVLSIRLSYPVSSFGRRNIQQDCSVSCYCWQAQPAWALWQSGITGACILPPFPFWCSLCVHLFFRAYPFATTDTMVLRPNDGLTAEVTIIPHADCCMSLTTRSRASDTHIVFRLLTYIVVLISRFGGIP